MTLDEIIREVAHELDMPYIFVDRVYHAYWKGVRDYITSLPLTEELTDEEFLALRPNVNIPRIGKLNVLLDNYKRRRKVLEKYREDIKNKRLREEKEKNQN